MILKISLVLSILFIVCCLPTSFAANVTISDDTKGGILGALNDENLNNGDTVFLNSGTYNKIDQDTNILIDKNVTIQGNGPKEKVIIDAKKSSTIFAIGENLNVTFINITFANGFGGPGGAIYNQFPNTILTFINCTFINNTAIEGGAISNHGSIFTLENCIFINNKADGFGGAISYRSEGKSHVSVINSIFTNNSAENGGAIAILGSVDFDIINSTFTNNSARDNGGAIFNIRQEILQLLRSSENLDENLEVERNIDRINHNMEDSNLNIINSTFIGNSAKNNGGAIFNLGPQQILQQANQAMLAQANQDPQLGNENLDELVNLKRNENLDDFDEIHDSFVNYFLNVINSTFIGNIANNNGGAIYTEASYTMISGSNFTENSQAIFINGPATVITCNIYNNLQGIVIVDSSGDVTINYNRIFNNTNTTGYDVDIISLGEEESRIRDADMAEEMMDYEKQNILQQASEQRILDNEMIKNQEKLSSGYRINTAADDDEAGLGISERMNEGNINLDYNWWGSNTPKVNATLNNFFVMNVINTTPLNFKVVTFAYTFGLNTGEKVDNGLLPYFETDVFKSLTNGAINSFDARFDNTITLESSGKSVYTFVTDNEVRIFEIGPESEINNDQEADKISDDNSSDSVSEKRFVSNQANSGNDSTQVAKASMKETGIPLIAILLVLLSLIGVIVSKKQK